MTVRTELGWRGRPFAGAIGLRPPIAEHADAEGRLLEQYAEGAHTVVEIGVAEGVSARRLRAVMDRQGTLYLIDPFRPGNVGISFTRMVARRAVGGVRHGRAVWFRKKSYEVAPGWNREIDFLFIDGDHSFEGVSRDWEEWSRHVKPGGRVALHDAVMAKGSWASPADGPARLFENVIARSSEWAVLGSAVSMVVVERRPET
jgi:predicted O-methyltransferase YrrM